MARAVVESVAENTVDAVVAPALWAAALGAPGVLAHRAVNTLDAMVGHRSARYARFGWASARLDDVAAWVPARLTAVLVAAVRPPVGRRGVAGRPPRRPRPPVAERRRGRSRLRRRPRPPPRRRQPLRRPGRGPGPTRRPGRPPDAADIDAAVRLARDVGWALAGGTRGGGAAPIGGRRTAQAPAVAFPTVAGTELIWAFRVMRLPLLDADGAAIGRIEDIVSSPRAGRTSHPKSSGSWPPASVATSS